MNKTNTKNPSDLQSVVEESVQAFDSAVNEAVGSFRVKETGRILRVEEGIAVVDGLPKVKSEELVRLPGERLGMAFNLDEGSVGLILLDRSEGIGAGDEVERTGRVLDVPVGDWLLGRVIDPLGRALDDGGALPSDERMPIEREAPGIMDRAPVTEPLHTGLKVIDALIPIGRGQRELILGDRQTGKTAIVVDTILNQRDTEVVCIYCAVGQQSSSVAKVVADLRKHGATDYTLVVVAGGDDAPGLQYVAPYAAMTMAEYFRDRGDDALVIFDDLTRHARAYRELSLLLRRPPGREAYPGDIFYVHSHLLERSTHLNEELGGGSLTALPIIETQAQNVSAYIPTNLISITDGQIYLSPDLFNKGLMPAVDVGKSVSRVGGKTQLPAYREVASDLRLSYSQYNELEVFSRFGTRLDEETRKTLERGRRVRETLKQPQYATIPASEQILVLLSVKEGLFDEFDLDRIPELERRIREEVAGEKSELCRKIDQGEELDDEQREELVSAIRNVLAGQKEGGAAEENGDGSAEEEAGAAHPGGDDEPSAAARSSEEDDGEA